jgi:hypothetical protein
MERERVPTKCDSSTYKLNVAGTLRTLSHPVLMGYVPLIRRDLINSLRNDALHYCKISVPLLGKFKIVSLRNPDQWSSLIPCLRPEQSRVLDGWHR